MANQQIDQENDPFKDEFKYYKRRKPPPDLSKVVDFRDIQDSKVVPVSLSVPPGPCLQGLRPVSQWQAFSHVDTPGFVVIRNPFEPWFQRYWLRRCLRDYPCLPHPCNLDAHQPRNTHHTLWEEALAQRDRETGSFAKTVLHKLRWVTLGYHHNWDTKEYSSDAVDTFPADLAALSRYMAAALGYEDFSAEAAIVNYYHLDSTLAGHTDHSEKDMSAPLFSFSFGCSCIFLLGGPTKETRPVAMFLRSGDIGVMQGPSRLAYHAVPRILPATSASDLRTDLGRSQKAATRSCPLPGDAADNMTSPWTVCPHHKPVICPTADDLGQASVNDRNIESTTADSTQKTADRDDITFKSLCSSEEVGNFVLGAKDNVNNNKGNNEHRTSGTKVVNDNKTDDKVDVSETKRMKLSESQCTCSISQGDSGADNLSHVSAEWCLVPGLLPSDVDELCDEENWEPYDTYLRTSRINMNVRQVLPKGQASLH